MLPPEVILDRWIKEQALTNHSCVNYIGKLDLEKIEPPSFRSFLSFVQMAMNNALASEGVNASGGVKHPPFHFDYIQVSDNKRNAHAFQYKGFSFIAITLPLVQLLWDVSVSLSKSTALQNLLQTDTVAVKPDKLAALLFQIQLTFLVSHEYTHHVHLHCSANDGSLIWTELFEDNTSGNLDAQAKELDADAYAIYLVLTHFLRESGRESALAQLEQQGLANLRVDELFLTCFFVSVTALFCAIWPDDIATQSIKQLSHPPAPVRIEYAIRIAKMWCTQNESFTDSWFTSERFQTIFLTAIEAFGGTTRHAWDAHIQFLHSEAGKQYDQSLLERFEEIRRSVS